MQWELVVKQPSMLEDLAISTLVKWHISPVRKCVYPIWENPQIETTVQNVVSTQTEIGRRYFSAIPKKFHDKLIAEAVRELSTITEDIWGIISERRTPLYCGNFLMELSKQELEKFNKQMERDMSFNRNLSLQVKLVGQMIETFFTEKVTSLEFSYHHMFPFVLSISKFNLLPNLTSLTIDCHNGNRYYKIVEIETRILEILKESKNLKYFKLRTAEIDDEILSCIVDNCKLIEELDFRSSKLNDDSVHLFTQLPNLKTFHVDALTINCLKTVLLSCKRSENIHAEASIDFDLIKIIQNIASQTDNSDKLIKIKSYSGACTSEQIFFLANMCPLIDKLIIYGRRNKDIDLRALAGFNCLSHLHLEDYSFYGNHVKEVLDEIGQNLRSLTFVRDNQTDLNALIHISQKCLNLESLIFRNCSFTNCVPEYDEIKLPITPFVNLKTVHLFKDPFALIQQDDNLMNEVVNFLLSNCLNIEYVKIEYFNKIRAFNAVDVRRLRYLKELEIKVNDDTDTYRIFMDEGNSYPTVNCNVIDLSRK